VFFKKVSDSMEMRKEIENQGKSLFLTIEKELEKIKNISKDLLNCKRFIFSGCGDKHIVSLSSKYLWNYISEKPLDVIHSWVLKNYPTKILNERTCVVFISQSGTTYDTVEACKFAIERKCKVVTITNLKEEKENSLVDICENYKNGYVIRTHTIDYPEKSLPSTGSFHTALMALNLFTLFVNKGHQKLFDMHTIYIPKIVDQLSLSQDVKDWALNESKKLRKFNNFYVLGFGPAYLAARKQARIMMMEGSKVNSCDIEGEEFIHSLIETLESKPNPIILLKPSVEWLVSYKNFRMVKKLWFLKGGEKIVVLVDPFIFMDKK